MQKSITFNRANKDFDMFLDGRHIGSRERYHEAEVELDRLAYEALAHDAGPVELAVEGALEREALNNSRHAVTATDKADRAYFRRATTAFTRALEQYRDGVRPELLQSGAWLLPSSTAGEPPHIVRLDGDWVCSCKAQASMHWPLAMVIGIEQANEDMNRFDDGDIDVRGVEPVRVGSYADAKRRYYAARDALARAALVARYTRAA